VLDGYRSLLMQHQYPQVVISLNLSPTNVDINVHPAKAQVKFLSPGTIFRLISSTIKEALAGHMGAPKQESNLDFSREIQTAFIEDAVTHYNQKTLDLAPIQHKPVETSNEEKLQSVWSSIQVIGQYANTYIIGQSRNSLVLIDQHAAHERVLFERLKKSWNLGQIEKQPSLFDETLTLSREAIEALTSENIIQIFTKMGFDLADRGPTALGVSARPAFLVDIGLEPLFEKLSEQVLEVNSISNIDDLLNDLWASMSCHGAVRAGKVLSSDEMKALLFQMDEFSLSHFCPHGRPVSINWNLYDLEKLFRRIV
jgi:DNA mismatch repair protein MutL